MNVVREDQRGKPALRVAQAMMVHLVLLVRGDHLDLRARWDSLDPKDLLAQPVRTDYLDTLGNEVKLVSKARQAPLVLLVWLVLRVPQERLALLVNVVTQAHLVPPENKASRGLLGKKVQRVILVLRALRGRMVHRASEDSLVNVDSPDPSVRSV